MNYQSRVIPNHTVVDITDRASAFQQVLLYVQCGHKLVECDRFDILIDLNGESIIGNTTYTIRNWADCRNAMRSHVSMQQRVHYPFLYR